MSILLQRSRLTSDASSKKAVSHLSASSSYVEQNSGTANQLHYRSHTATGHVLKSGDLAAPSGRTSRLAGIATASSVDPSHDRKQVDSRQDSYEHQPDEKHTMPDHLSKPGSVQGNLKRPYSSNSDSPKQGCLASYCRPGDWRKPVIQASLKPKIVALLVMCTITGFLGHALSWYIFFTDDWLRFTYSLVNENNPIPTRLVWTNVSEVKLITLNEAELTGEANAFALVGFEYRKKPTIYVEFVTNPGSREILPKGEWALINQYASGERTAIKINQDSDQEQRDEMIIDEETMGNGTDEADDLAATLRNYTVKFRPTSTGIWGACVDVEYKVNGPPSRQQEGTSKRKNEQSSEEKNNAVLMTKRECISYDMAKNLVPTTDSIIYKVLRFRRQVVATVVVFMMLTVSTLVVGIMAIILGQVLGCLINAVLFLVSVLNHITLLIMFYSIVTLHEDSCLPPDSLEQTLISLAGSPLPLQYPCYYSGFQQHVEVSICFKLSGVIIFLYTVSAFIWLAIYTNAKKAALIIFLQES